MQESIIESIIEIEIEIDKGSSTMSISIVDKIDRGCSTLHEINKGRSTLHEIETEIDNLININVMLRPTSREPRGPR
jgi:hypothetical protein